MRFQNQDGSGRHGRCELDRVIAQPIQRAELAERLTVGAERLPFLASSQGLITPVIVRRRPLRGAEHSEAGGGRSPLRGGEHAIRRERGCAPVF